jgi:uncharacterized LabA/DUF88 family protein
MVLNIFPKRREVSEPAVEPEPTDLPEPSEDALEAPRKRTRRGSRGGRGRKRPDGTFAEQAESSAEPEEARAAPVVESPQAGAPRRPRAPRATARVAAVAAPPVPAPEAPPEKPTRRRATRAAEEPAAEPDTTAVLRALESQSRQIEELVRLSRDGGGHAAATAARVGVFVDAANIELACDRLRTRFDWGKVLATLTRGRQLVRAITYSPVHDDPGVSLETQRFVEPFLDKGFKVVTKPLRRFQDGTIKANLDIELALDIVTMLDRLDVVCLVSGDGDFQRLVEFAQSHGVRVEVVGVGSSTASNLRHAADAFIDLGSRAKEFRA